MGRSSDIDPDFPSDVFAGDASLDYTSLYLEGGPSAPPEKRIAARTSVRALVTRETVVQYPPMTGTRVAFSTDLEAVLSYANPPAGGSTGTIVTVRTASGDVNHHSGMVFVKWDTGRMMRVYASHLRPSGHHRIADAVVRRASELGDLGDFLKLSKDTLVHKATKDLWSLRKVGEDFVVERLFDETGDPLKV